MENSPRKRRSLNQASDVQEMVDTGAEKIVVVRRLGIDVRRLSPRAGRAVGCGFGCALSRALAATLGPLRTLDSEDVGELSGEDMLRVFCRCGRFCEGCRWCLGVLREDC